VPHLGPIVDPHMCVRVVEPHVYRSTLLFKALIFLSLYKYLQGFICIQCETSTQAFNPHFYITILQ
jgi:hypothetical protein